MIFSQKDVRTCRHYWVLDSTNVGMCRLCGETRQFPKVSEIDFSRVKDIPESVLIKAGGSKMDNGRSRCYPLGRLTTAEIEELVGSGPDAFLENHGYPKGRAGTGVKGLYKRLTIESEPQTARTAARQETIGADAREELEHIKHDVAEIKQRIADGGEGDDTYTGPESGTRYIHEAVTHFADSVDGNANEFQKGFVFGIRVAEMLLEIAIGATAGRVPRTSLGNG